VSEPFPGTPLLYDFSGPAENPLYMEGAWGATWGGHPPLRKEVGYVSLTTEFTPNKSTLFREAFRADPGEGTVEVWACTDGGQLGAALESWRVTAYPDPANLVGYELIFGGGIGKGYFLRRYDGGGSFTGLAEVGDGYPQMIGMRITPVGVEAWGYDGATWTQKLTSGDTGHRGAFYLGLALEEQGGINELSISCFGGGVPRRTQFFRWTRAFGEELPV